MRPQTERARGRGEGAFLDCVRADANRDTVVDVSDLLVVLASFDCTGGSTACALGRREWIG
eukprot:COSAG01_NODE_68459_length_264_cov_0.618182_1_plen_60_part_01